MFIPTIEQLSCLQARHRPGKADLSLYGKEWETCTDSEGLLHSELAMLAADWALDEGRETEFRVIHGVEIPDDVVLACDADLGCTALAAETLDWVAENTEHPAVAAWLAEINCEVTA